MQALKIAEYTRLMFTTVMDELARGLVDEDEDAEATPTDRAYWESKATKATVAIVDQLMHIVHEFDPPLSLKYNKFYILVFPREGVPISLSASGHKRVE